MGASETTAGAPTPRLRLEGRRVLITGGASGIGLAAARLCRDEGARVALLDRDRGALELAARTLGAAAFVADIADPDAVKTAVDGAAEAMGGIDGLIHAAGVLVSQPFETTSLETWRRVIDVNLTGAFVVCQAATPWLRQAEEATIVTVASATGLMPATHPNSAYAASKAGLIGLTRAMAAELAPAIRVNAVCPGAVDTPMTAPFKDPAQPGAFAAYPLRREATPEEIGHALVFLTSRDSGYVTGVALAVDGGRTFH